MTHIIEAREPRPADRTPDVYRGEDAVAGHLEDAAHFPGGKADAIARPRSEGEVAALLFGAGRVLPIGAQSSVTGGATPTGGLLLSTDRLTGIEDAGPTHVRVGAGVPLDTLQAHLRTSSRWYAPAPTFTGAFAGGIVATNAAGAATFKYGTTRSWVDGLTVMLPCGHVLDIERGTVRADPGRGFAIRCPDGERKVLPGSYVMPGVPKCSAGYFAAPDMELIDLFIGAEGTLGVIMGATLRVAPLPGSTALALVPMSDEASGLALVSELREASRQTWASRDAHGIDVAAIEHLDRRCLTILHEDGIDRAQQVNVAEGTALLLLVQLEFSANVTAAQVYDDIAGAMNDGPDSSIRRFCRRLWPYGALDRAEIAAPGDIRRTQQFLALREGAPTGVNRRVGDAKRLVDARIDKTAADMIVPFDRFADMMVMYREGYERRGLDYAIWGHISDGNVHPNVIPRSHADVVKGREAILEFGREVVRLGGSPLAEHGVGRSTIKQTLLRQLYGERGIEQMRAIKREIDPDWKLAPGVIFQP